MEVATAPAYYAKGRSGWRAWWTLLHPPYTLMHLSFVVAGAAVAPVLDGVRLVLTLLAFFLAMGVAAHCLDEWKGRPLGTTVPGRTLAVLAASSLFAAAGVGIWGAVHYDLLEGLSLVGLGVFFVVAYNLELFGGRVHTDLGFAVAWGAFPALVGYYAQTGAVTPIALGVVLYAFLASLVQRHLSTPARALRRRTEHIEGRIVHRDGRVQAIDRAYLLRPMEQALRGLVLLSVVVAGMLSLRHIPL